MSQHNSESSTCGEQSTSRSGITRSVWHPESADAAADRADGPLQADVVIVGAGIAGLTAAYLLSGEGKSVVVVDEKPLGGGETGRTSAHLASIIDDRFFEIEKTLGRDGARLAHESHAAAVDLIEQIDRKEALGSEFARLDAYLFEEEGKESSDRLAQERDAATRAGVRGAQLLAAPGIPGPPRRPCVRFPNQARFHPLKYLNGLAGVLRGRGVRLLLGHRVMDLAGNGPVHAKLDNDVVITAGAGIAATNVPTPINNWMGLYLKQSAYRTYMVGFRVAPSAIGDALYWDMADPYHYVRLHQSEGGLVLLVGGEDHRTGQPPQDPDEPFRKLTEWTRRWFPAAGADVCRWSGQVSEPDDGVAFIGRVPTKEHSACYVITGDSGMGLTHGTLGARLVADLILGQPNPWTELYSPARKPVHNVGTFVSENVTSVAQYADALRTGEKEREISPGEGGVVRNGLHLLAEHRDQAGRVHACSAFCTHLKGVVRWNPVEKTWDCPVHGSRFGPCGKVIIGPAVEDLPRAEARENEKQRS